MAAEDTKASAEAVEEVVVVTEMATVEVTEKELPPPPAECKAEEEKEESTISQSISFKEESNKVGELPDSQKKALEELKQLVKEALEKHEFTAPPPPPPKEEEKKEEVKEEEEKKEEAKEEKPAEEAVVVGEELVPSPTVEVKEEETVVVVEEVVEKVEAVVVDEDGAKTVEAIKETIIEEVSAATIKTEEPAAPLPSTSEPEPECAPAAEPKAEPVPVPEPEPATPIEPEEVSLWGVPLLCGEKSDVVLLKFLRARDFKPKEALAMLKSTVRWRKEFGVEALLKEDLGLERLEEFVYIHGAGRDGHPVCYNLYGELGYRKELYEIAFADEEKRKNFLKWRVQAMEKHIEKHIDFSPDGVCTFVQVNDMKNSPGLLQRELRATTNKVLQLLQDNYPEFVVKQVFINVPWWYLLLSRMISPFVTLRSKSKFVLASPAKSAETLFKYIAPEHVPMRFGGLSREGEHEFTTTDSVTEIAIKPAAKHTIEFPVSECHEVVWELRVVGWKVSYGAEFVPASEGSYTVIVSKTKAMSCTTPDDEAIIGDSFKATESGKVVITIDNHASKKKKVLLYRSKTKPAVV